MSFCMRSRSQAMRGSTSTIRKRPHLLYDGSAYRNGGSALLRNVRSATLRSRVPERKRRRNSPELTATQRIPVEVTLVRRTRVAQTLSVKQPLSLAQLIVRQQKDASFFATAARRTTMSTTLVGTGMKRRRGRRMMSASFSGVRINVPAPRIDQVRLCDGTVGLKNCNADRHYYYGRDSAV